jgi:uncharacterized membrane protein YfbV (UPF0208 family)
MVPTVRVTLPLVEEELRVTPVDCPPPVQVAPSPPVAVVEVCWQVRVTVPVYPATEAILTATVELAPGATVAGETVPGVSV